MSDFDTEPDTRPCITGCLMALVETTAAVNVTPDFVDEVTIERNICWRHGAEIVNDRGERVRLPVYVETCGGCK